MFVLSHLPQESSPHHHEIRPLINSSAHILCLYPCHMQSTREGFQKRGGECERGGELAVKERNAQRRGKRNPKKAQRAKTTPKKSCAVLATARTGRRHSRFGIQNWASEVRIEWGGGEHNHVCKVLPATRFISRPRFSTSVIGKEWSYLSQVHQSLMDP